MSIEKFNNQMNAIEEQELKITSEDFNKQFEKETAEVDGHTFEFTKVEPSETISDRWVVFLGGFGAGAEEYRAEIEDLARSGRKVFFLNPLKGIEMNQHDIEAIDEFNIPETIQRKTAEVLKALDSTGIERADFVGHSQGAILGSLVASLRPGIAADLVLNNPGGMHGEDTRRAMVGRTVGGLLEQVVTSIKKARTESGGVSRLGSVAKSVLTGTEILKNPKYRATQEVPGIVNSNIIPVLEALKAKQEDTDKESRTKTTLVTANKDRTFSPERIENEIGFDASSQEAMEHALETVVDSYVMYTAKDAGHEASIYEKSGLTAQIVNEKYVGNENGPEFSTSHNIQPR